MARFMRATHGNTRDVSMGGPHKAGHDEFFLKEQNRVTWVARIREP